MAAPCRRLPVVVVLGATGTGKSKLAIELAKVFSGEIINADSMQVYKGLDIITNKVTKEERAECPHHLLDHVSPLNLKYTISDFQAASIPLIDSLLNTGKLPVVVGGTHYYIESLLWKFLINQQDLPEHVAQEDDSSHRKVTERVAGSMGEKDQEMSEDIGTDLVPPHPDLTEDSPVTKRRRISSKQDDHQVISVSDTNTSGLLHKPQRDSSTITFESSKVITEKPTTDVPTITEKPTTDVPTITEKPTTDVPTITEKPTTDVSTITEKPTTDVPTITLKPTTDVPTITEKPTTDVSTITLKPTTDVPTITEKPTTDVSTITEKPTTDVSTITEKPTTDVPTITEKPTTDASTSTEKPTTDVSTITEKPTTDVPTITEKPTTDVPTITEKPTTDVPTITEKPTTDVSTITLKPTTDVSTITLKPTTDVPTITEKPTTDVSTITEKPTTDASTITEKPTTDVSTITEKPTTDVSTITLKPTTDVSTITEKPTTDVPTMIHSSFIDNKVELVKTEGEDGTCDQMESLAPDSLIGDNTTDEDIDVEDISRYPLKDIRQWGYHVVPAQLHARLKRLDPASAMKIHPNDYRKIIRTLEIYEKHGIAKSEILKEQHKLVGSDALSGPLRYLKCCIFWVQCDQEVLNKRLDDRVDGMLARGLVKEMLDFHKQYNESRFKEERESDYSLGIFQSIGFKEFHEYLLLSEEDRNTEKGKHLFNEGVEDLKRVTRKYARKQIRWLKNRLLKRSADNVPPVYGLNATHVADWDRLVLEPAVHVIQAMIKDERPDIAPIPPLDEPKNKHVFKTCDICDGIILTTEKDFKMHMSGRRHKKNLARKKAAESVISEIQTKKENIADESSLPVKS